MDDWTTRPSLVRSEANDRIFGAFGEERHQGNLDSRTRDPYLDMGSHPDAVERVMDELGAALPAHCRFLAHGRALLADPSTGRVLAMPFGTAYVLWLPEPMHSEALAAGLVSARKWKTGRSTDLERELGPGWLFGAWRHDEARWVRAAHDSLQPNVNATGT